MWIRKAQCKTEQYEGKINNTLAIKTEHNFSEQNQKIKEC